MKKSVAVLVLVLIIIPIVLAGSKSYVKYGGIYYSPLTGMQSLDLPPPPAAPGMEASQPVSQPAPQPVVVAPPVAAPVVSAPAPTSEAAELLESIPGDVTALSDRVDVLEAKSEVIDLLPGFEDRLNRAEAAAAQASGVVARIDALQSQSDAMRVELENIRQLGSRPYVEEPAFFGSLKSLEGSIRAKAILSISLAVFALLFAVGLLVMAIVNRKQAYEQNRNLIVQYLKNYQRAGYKLETLKMHLSACGWAEDFIESAAKDAQEASL